MRPRRVYRLLLLASGLVSVALALVGYGFGVLQGADLSTVDLRFSVRGERDAPRDIVFVKIDGSTFNHLGDEFPFPRGLHANVIDNVSEDGPRAIAYDVQFTEPSSRPAQDEALVESVRRAGNVVLATTEVSANGRTRIFGGGEGLEYSRAVASNSEVPLDSGGVIRRMDFGVYGLPSFSLAAAEQARGGKIDLPQGQTAWIDYAGPPGALRSIPFWRVEAGRFPKGLFRDKVVVVGASATSLQDLHPTSTTGRDPMPGPEIHANAIDTIQRGFPLGPVAGWVNVALILLMGAVAPLLALRLSAIRALLAAGVFMAGFAAAAQLLFNAGIIVTVVYPLIAALLSAAATVVLYGVTTAFERERARDAFARFVPESVVGQVLDQAGGVRLGGTRAEGTVLFSDLRGFTSFAERREPDEVIDILNRYLTAMSDAILDEGGTVVAYMGDGIMAVFGAPIEQADHADRALRASREMLRRLDGFNAWLTEQGLAEGFKMGIGINSGFVMSGNVGSERRLEYTAIGDTTNTAARLEGMTKGTAHQIYVADATHQALLEPVAELESVGEFEVRGRERSIRLWSLPSTRREEPARARSQGENADVRDRAGSLSA